jgi:hypothetical protein
MRYIKRLIAIHYPPDMRWKWEAMDTPSPDWPNIEQALRRLDRREWPIVHLRTREDAPGREPENALTVTGGRGEYSITFMPEKGPELHYFDESRGDKVIRVWETDQGSYEIERHLCNQLAGVLSIARHFVETGELDTSIPWKAY